MKKTISFIMFMAVLFTAVCPMLASAADAKIYVDQDFTQLRPGFVSKYGGASAIGAYEEDHMRFGLNGDQLLSNGDGYYVGFVTYKVEAGSGKEFSNITLDLVGRIASYDGAEGRSFEEWKKTNWLRIYVFTGDTYKFNREKWTDFENNVAYKPTLEQCATIDCKYSYDFANWVKGAKTVYITLATYLECTPSWIGFSKLTLTGVTKAASATSTKTSSTSASSKSASSAVSSNNTSSDAQSDSSVDSSTDASSTDTSDTAVSETSSVGAAVSESSDNSSLASTGGTEDSGFPGWAIALIIIAVLGGGGAAAYFLIFKKKSGAV